MRIEWTKEALRNLDMIYQFIANQNTDTAVRTYNAILEETDILSIFPSLAPMEYMLEGEPQSFRSLVILSGRFKVIYYVENDSIYITHLWDCRWNPEKIKQQRSL